MLFAPEAGALQFLNWLRKVSLQPVHKYMKEFRAPQILCSANENTTSKLIYCMLTHIIDVTLKIIQNQHLQVKQISKAYLYCYEIELVASWKATPKVLISIWSCSKNYLSIAVNASNRAHGVHCLINSRRETWPDISLTHE